MKKIITPFRVGLLVIGAGAILFFFLTFVKKGGMKEDESVLLFAVNYLSISEYPGEIAGLTTPLDAVYFTMTTLMTIGFGDIAASGQIARGAVLLQMLFSLLLLTASARLLTSLIKSVTRDVGHDPDTPA